jgi:antitoxin (DNA-binding transcriptional repressor) of toxin-antitoxin stability system
MYVTATEFRTNVGKYLDFMQNEDVFITRHGKTVGVLTASNLTKFMMIDSLAGSLKIDGDVDVFMYKKMREDYEGLD